MKDIDTRKDIEMLVDHFYSRVEKDALLAPVFSTINLPDHLPVMYQFWASMLLGEQSYRGNPFTKHVALPINRNHFAQWLTLFTQTVDENFCGEKAEEAKMRAHSIAHIFQSKMGLL